MDDDGGEVLKSKICLIGSCGVGKTCIIARKVSNTFCDNVASTNGASFSQIEVQLKTKKVLFDCWDTAGQEKYRSLGKNFYQDAYVVVLVYDITRMETFIDLKEKWYEDVKKYGEKFNTLIVVGNKVDLYEKEAVVEETAKIWANEIGAVFLQTSAKIGESVDKLFELAAKSFDDPNFVKKWKESENDKERNTSKRLEDVQNDLVQKKNKKFQKEKGGCC